MEQEKVLVITYYWPPSGGSGVQRWMYFCKYLPQNGILPYVVTVDPAKASYKFTDISFLKHVEHIPVFRTRTFEPLRLYSRLTTGSSSEGIPQAFAGEKPPGPFKRLARYIRGNWFIPDARKGWNKHCYKKAAEIIAREKITKVITTGPPHSTHLVGLKLKKNFGVKWLVDFRDPWTEMYYNKYFHRTAKSIALDKAMEMEVVTHCDKLISVGPSMARLVASKIPQSAAKVSYVLNGFDDDLFTGEQPSLPKDVFVISHIGILGETQPIDSFLDAFATLYAQSVFTDSGKIVFKITGKVSPVILESIKSKCPWLTYEITDYVPHAEAIALMKQSHLLFNSLAETENARYIISGKLMEYLATGNPVLCLGVSDGDAAALLKDYAYCSVFSRDNTSGVANFIKDIYNHWKTGDPVRRAKTEIPYSRKNTAKQVAALIKEL